MAVKEWIDGGASLAEVQTRLKDELGVSLTFMDVRMLVLDIGAEVQDKPEPVKSVPDDATAADEDDFDDMEGDSGSSGGGKVTLSLDRIMRPGAMASGDVTFSDGQKATWILDQTGRLGLEGAPKGYQPPQEDIAEFQVQLQQMLSRGY